MKDYQKFLLVVLVFLLAYFVPFQHAKVMGAVREALVMLHEYARQHVLLCLVPAFFIAGAISCFVSQSAVMKYLGVAANKILAYSIASVSGTILARTLARLSFTFDEFSANSRLPVVLSAPRARLLRATSDQTCC